LAKVKSMHRVDAFGNSPGVCRKLTEGIGNDGPRYSLGIEPSSDDAVGSHRKFAKRFTKRIGKLTGKKIGGLAARLPEYAGVGS
ncbi:hypothetical protein GW17_00061506, partial [Ensete ventricosum]